MKDRGGRNTERERERGMVGERKIGREREKDKKIRRKT